MIVRGPKEVLLELLALNSEIERVEDLRRKWKLTEIRKEELLHAIIRQNSNDQE